MTFAARFPALFHVADRPALDGIRQHGLLSARGLVRLHGGDPAVLSQNRGAYVDLAPGAALRRQGMRDPSLRPRLHPSITPDQWRGFINGLVFLFPSQALALRFVNTEPERDQVVLRYATADLLRAAVCLSTCQYNNGYIDRAPVATARQRRFTDYRPIATWSGEPVREVVALDTIPPSVAFTIIAPP